ncbi:MAG: hypothetical protein V2A73_00575 [Pseudomonadota bacterium]
MELDAFRSRLGIGQGRILPASTPVVSGQHVFVLGDEEPGRRFDLGAGDHAEAVQDVDLTGVDLVRAGLRLRIPADVPDGLAWEAAIVIDGTKYASVTGRPGKERQITDLAANVSKLVGVHTIGVRLELVEVERG